MQTARFQDSCYGKLESYGEGSGYDLQPSVKEIRNYIGGMAPGKKILDVGCANGLLLSGFTKKHRVFGIDISKQLVSEASSRGVLAKVGNLEKEFPFKESFFDVVVVHHVIEHILDTDKFLSECNRILRRNGSLAVTFPNTSNPVSMILLMLDFPAYMGSRYRSTHVRDFTIKTIKIALMNNGFRVDKIVGGSLLVLRNYRLLFLTKWFPRLGADVTLNCRKIKELGTRKGPRYDFGLSYKNFLKDL